mgnify:CR=1 FL=1
MSDVKKNGTINGLKKSIIALNRSKKVSRSKSGTFVLIVFLGIVAIFMALPMVYTISNSLKPRDELFVFPPKIFPTNPTFRNFRDMFTFFSSSNA